MGGAGRGAEVVEVRGGAGQVTCAILPHPSDCRAGSAGGRRLAYQGTEEVEERKQDSFKHPEEVDENN